MNDRRDNPRWPIVEIILLAFFLVPFTDAVPLIGGLRPLCGRIPGWLQLGIIFLVAPFILLSSTRLALRAAHAKRKAKAAVSAVCALAGLLATVLATAVTAALGAGPRATGFAAAGLVAAAAIVFGGNIKRKSRSRWALGHEMKKTSIIPAVVVATALVAVCVVPWLLPARARPKAKDGCASHLKQLGMLFQYYAIDHAGRYPDSWQSAHDLFALLCTFSPAERFVCPLSGHSPGSTNEVDSWCSFFLVSELTTNTPTNRIHAGCRPENHRGKGANVLFTDGSVRWYQTVEFNKLLKNQGIELPQPSVARDAVNHAREG